MLNFDWVSDLPRDEQSQDVNIITPNVVFGTTAREVHDECIVAYEQVMRFQHIEHYGLLRCGVFRDYDRNRPLKLEKRCGGTLSLNVDTVFAARRVEYVMTCDRCELSLYCRSASISYRDLLLHLMLRQMLPYHFDSLNFVNCTKYIGCRTDYDAVVGLGVVSIALNSLWQHREMHSNRAHLGFMLAPNMDTCSKGEKYFQWLQYLIGKKMEQLEQACDWMKGSVLGPVTARR